MANNSDLNKVIKSLHAEEVVCLPTETVMGLAIRYDSIPAFNRLIEIKNRPAEKAFPLVVGKKEEIAQYGVVNEKIKRVIDYYMPGPLTIIFKKQDYLDARITNYKDSIAIRIPQDEFLLKVLDKLKVPILLTSANKSGEPSCINSDEAKSIFKDEIKIIVDGKAKYKIASTIVDATKENLTLIRQGVIDFEEIKAVYEGEKL